MTVNRRPFSHLNPTDGLTPVALSRSASTALAYFQPSTSVLITPQASKAERESDESGKSECGQSGHVCDSSCWDAKYSKVAALVLFATL